jgi:hypothetical protein
MVPIKQNVRRFSHKGTYSLSKTFGAPLVIPPTLGRIPKYIKDQGETNYCTAFARSAAGSYLYGREMSEEYLTAKEGEVIGAPIFMGADPASADTAVANYGFLPKEQSPFSFEKDGWTVPAFWNSYPPALDGQAIVHCPGQPYNVYPDYQSIKNALISGNGENAIVTVNGYWYGTWQNPIGGILPTPTGSPVSRHSWDVIDYKICSDGVERLVMQLSQGTSWGDGGILYADEECLNTAFKNPALNGLGATQFRLEGATPIQTQIHTLQLLIMKLGELLAILRLQI